MTSPLQPRIRAVREARGVGQQALAARVGISRQALSALEQGRAIPRTDVALRLAAALGVTVEGLFAPTPAETVHASLARGATVRAGDRVVLARRGDDWVASPVPRSSPGALLGCDGVVEQTAGRGVTVELLHGTQAAQDRLVVMGCAPALGLLTARLAAADRRVALGWVHGTSAQALEALARGEVHLAGLHLRDARSGHFNVPHVQRRFSDQRMLVVNFAAWEQGLVVAPGNPLGIRGVNDLLRPRLRVVAREPGSGANKLLEQLLDGDGPHRPPAVVARGHLEVATAVAQGAADVGVAVESVALAWGLGFIPLAAERFDLVFPEALARDERLERLIDELGSVSFKRELGSLGGYGTAHSGQVTRT